MSFSDVGNLDGSSYGKYLKFILIRVPIAGFLLQPMSLWPFVHLGKSNFGQAPFSISFSSIDSYSPLYQDPYINIMARHY